VCRSWSECLTGDTSMKRCAVLPLFAMTVASVALMHTEAQGTEVGEISDLHAWIDRTRPGPTSIHTIGKIMAPTACYDALVEFAGAAGILYPSAYQYLSLLHAAKLCR
jgi:hypothetical protein